MNDASGRFLLVNDTYSAITGYPEQELVQMDDEALMHPDDREPNRQLNQRLFSGELSRFVCETRYTRKDGAQRWVRRNVLAAMDNGNTPLMLALVEDITARKRTESELKAERNRVREAFQQVEFAQEEERKRLGRELHDGVAQLVAAVSMNLTRLLQSDPGPQTRNEVLEETVALAAECSRAVRTLSFLLLAPACTAAGCAAAVDAYAREFGRRSGIAVQTHVSPEFGKAEGETARALFRTLQEALTNVYRHSGSRTARVRLHRHGRWVELAVEDDGLGMGDAQPGVGLASMRDRAELLGGEVDFVSGPQGTRVVMRLPDGSGA